MNTWIFLPNYFLSKKRSCHFCNGNLNRSYFTKFSINRGISLKFLNRCAYMTKIHFLMLTFLDSVNIWLQCTFIEIAKNYKENIHAETLITFAICSISSIFCHYKIAVCKRSHTRFWKWENIENISYRFSIM